MSSEFLFLSWCCRWAAHPSHQSSADVSLPAGTTCTSCCCSLQSQHCLMLAFSRLPSSSSQCSAELSSGSGKQNCWSGMICCDFSSSSGCPSAQVHPRPSQDLDLVQLSPSACRHKPHGDHNSWIYFQFHELALQQLYLISSAPGAGCPARITLLFDHIGRAAVPVALQCIWN